MILNAFVEKLKRRSRGDFKDCHDEAALIIQAVSRYLHSTVRVLIGYIHLWQGGSVSFLCQGAMKPLRGERAVGIDLDTSVNDFWAARARGEYFPKAYFDRLSLDDAYRIQLALIDRRVAEGEQHIGWKVGLTAKAIQEQFGFYEPVFGCILETQSSGHVFRPQELINPGFETELCMRLAHDLEGSMTVDEVRGAITVIHPAFEVVETRGDLVRHTAVGLADNAQQRSVVLGEARPVGDLDLERVEAQVFLNGQELARGSGSAVLGNPLQSIAWLSLKLPEFGRKLRAGDIVMTGSFVRQFPLAPGDRVHAVFSKVGEVEFEVAAH